MATKAEKEAEKKLIRAERMILALEERLKQEKENHKITKEKYKSVTGKFSRRDQLSKELKEELTVLKKKNQPQASLFNE